MLGLIRPARAALLLGALLGLGLCAAFSSVATAVATTTKQDALLELAAAVDADELSRATIVQQLGDETLLAALHQSEDVLARLAAVRCSPYLHDPDRALPDLVAIARGRDPELAPAAAQRLFAIAQRLLFSRATAEQALAGMHGAQRELKALADDASALPAVRRLAGQSSYLLWQLLVQAGAGLR